MSEGLQLEMRWTKVRKRQYINLEYSVVGKTVTRVLLNYSEELELKAAGNGVFILLINDFI